MKRERPSRSLSEIVDRRNGDAIQKRIKWIDDQLFWHRCFRRSDLMSAFSLSQQQASTDIANYLDLAPDNAKLDQRSKAYERQPTFEKVFAADVRTWLAAQTGNGLALEPLPLPQSQPDETVFATIAEGRARRLPVRLAYFDKRTGKLTDALISPHHVFEVRGRLMLRGWNDTRREFSDIPVSHITEAEQTPHEAWVDEAADACWREWIIVKFAPADHLSKHARTALERDYAMSRGQCCIDVRKALVRYVLEALGLSEEVKSGKAGGSELKCINAASLKLYA